MTDALDRAGVELQRRSEREDLAALTDDDREDKHTGRPGLDDEVRAVLSIRRRGDISKRAAAERLDVSMHTLGRAMDNIERYGLRPAADDPEELSGGDRQ